MQMRSVEFKLARFFRRIVQALSWVVFDVVGLKMFFTLVTLSIFVFLVIIMFNMSAILAVGIAFGIYLAAGGWRFVRVFILTIRRDLKSALFVLIPLRFHSMRNLRKKRTTAKIFRDTVEKYPNKTCFLFQDEKWTFSDVNAYANRVANFLYDSGYQKGDVIAIFSENCPEMVALWLGMSKVGVIGALINFNLRDVTLSHCIKISEAKAVIYGANLHEAVSDVRPNLPNHLSYFHIRSLGTPQFPSVSIDSATKEFPSCEPKEVGCSFTDCLFYIYTSGTTGLPKAAIITHLRFFYVAFGMNRFVNVTSNDVLYTALPLYHTAAGILGVGQAIICGTTVALRTKFSASQFWIDCVKYNATITQYIGEICRYLLAQPYRPEETNHSVRVAFGNGIKPQIWTQFKERFKIDLIGEFYGATEGNCNVVNVENKVGAVGFCSRILPFVYPITLIKVDPDTSEIIRDKNGVCIHAKPGEPGELMGKIVKSDPVRQFDGYVDSKATNKKIIHDVFKKGDRAFSTGDVLIMDDLGYLYFRDRTGDTFRWRGENVSTNEVEAIISNAVKLNDAVVYGVEIQGYEGKAGMAAIADEDNTIDVQYLAEAFQRSLPAYAKPMFLRFIKEIDTTGTFKLKKLKLREEGFNPNNVKDRLYYFDAPSRSYQPLTPSAYDAIMSGGIRL